MLGIERIKDWQDFCVDKVTELTLKFARLKHLAESVQSTNDKRYNEIKKEIDVLYKSNPKVEVKDIVTCDKCKCLLYKKDAIKGESRIKPKNSGLLAFATFTYNYTDGFSRTVEPEEEIEKVYLCHKCRGKSEKKGKVKKG